MQVHPESFRTIKQLVALHGMDTIITVAREAQRVIELEQIPPRKKPRRYRRRAYNILDGDGKVMRHVRACEAGGN